jgi:predicted tellurium resistance membrane protein TerC
MDLVAPIQTPHVWTGMMTIALVNIMLSGGNAAACALAARSALRWLQEPRSQVTSDPENPGMSGGASI